MEERRGPDETHCMFGTMAMLPEFVAFDPRGLGGTSGPIPGTLSVRQKSASRARKFPCLRGALCRRLQALPCGRYVCVRSGGILNRLGVDARFR